MRDQAGPYMGRPALKFLDSKLLAYAPTALLKRGTQRRLGGGGELVREKPGGGKKRCQEVISDLGLNRGWCRNRLAVLLMATHLLQEPDKVTVAALALQAVQGLEALSYSNGHVTDTDGVAQGDENCSTSSTVPPKHPANPQKFGVVSRATFPWLGCFWAVLTLRYALFVAPGSPPTWVQDACRRVLEVGCL